MTGRFRDTYEDAMAAIGAIKTRASEKQLRAMKELLEDSDAMILALRTIEGATANGTFINTVARDALTKAGEKPWPIER